MVLSIRDSLAYFSSVNQNIIQTTMTTSLKKIQVSQVMRRQVVKLPAEAALESALRKMIKFRVNALLVEHEENGVPAGVLSKTDIMGAYYVALPISIKVQDIMSRPVLTCAQEDSLEKALGQMKEARITRLYVTEGANYRITGLLAYPDVVGLMYRHCHYCRNSLFKGEYISGDTNKAILRFCVGDIMGTDVLKLPNTATIEQVMEELSMSRRDELLICSADGIAEGVITVNDLVLAFMHGRKSHEPALEIMSSPVRVCNDEAMLEEAIQTMIFSDISRLFVYREKQTAIVGVLTLVDTVKARSGSCRACIVSRISVRD